MEASGPDHCSLYENLANAFSGDLAWEWDDRFGGVLAAFEEEQKDRVSAVLASRFPQAWDSLNIKDAPEKVSAAMARFGGLHPGQLVYQSSVNRGVVLLGLWWPWSNGSTISIRFIPHTFKGTANDLEELHAAMRPIFGLLTT